MTIGIGIIGFGFIGRAHAAAFDADPRARLVAIADVDRTVSREGCRRYDTPEAMLADDEIDAVVVAVPTPLHPALAAAALDAGKHVLVEKPLAVTAAETEPIVEAAARHPQLICMPAHCMRFWPGWTWLKETIDGGSLGAVWSATFVRVGSTPNWGQAFYSDPVASGSAILDLHIHDADFVRYCFGDPVAVESAGARGATGGIDHVITRYRYDDGPGLVTAEGGWLPGPVPFEMRFRVSFEAAVAEFRLGGDPTLAVYRPGRDPEPIGIAEGDGYPGQARHFLDCIETGTQPTTVTLADGVAAVRLIDAERASIESA